MISFEGKPIKQIDNGANEVKPIDTWNHTKQILVMTDELDRWETEMYRDLIRDYVDLVEDC